MLLMISGNLSMAVTKAAPTLHLVLAALRPAHDLDQRHLRHGIEEVEADEAARIGQRGGDVLDHERGGVGRQHARRA